MSQRQRAVAKVETWYTVVGPGNSSGDVLRASKLTSDLRLSINLLFCVSYSCDSGRPPVRLGACYLRSRTYPEMMQFVKRRPRHSMDSKHTPKFRVHQYS